MEAEKPRKKGQGRRTNFEVSEEIILEVQLFSQKGMNQTHIRDYYGVSKSVWQRKMKSIPDLKKAYTSGKSRGISFVSGKLMELIKTGNLDAIKYYLSRVGKFTENPEIEDLEDDEKPRTIKKLLIAVTDPIEAAKIYQEFMKEDAENE